jgi:hypothetical protein
MPKEKPYECRIENFYKKKTIDIMMFAWVSCLEKNLPAVSQAKAIENFLAYMRLSEDDYPFDSAKVIYSQIKQDFLWSGIKTNSEIKSYYTKKNFLNNIVKKYFTKFNYSKLK